MVGCSIVSVRFKLEKVAALAKKSK